MTHEPPQCPHHILVVENYPKMYIVPFNYVHTRIWSVLECGCKVEELNGKGVDGDGVIPKVSPRDTVE